MKQSLMLFLIGAGLSMTAQAKEVRCDVVVDNGQGGSYSGKCEFKPVSGRNDGSFTLAPSKGKKMLVPYLKISSVTVLIDRNVKSKAVLFYNGDRSSIATVYRNGACWSEDEYTNNVCAYAK